MLADDGASIPPKLIHRVVQHADRPELASMLGVLLEEGADPNGLSDGLTPLMRASLRGDPETAYMLMAFGANPGVVSADGRRPQTSLGNPAAPIWKSVWSWRPTNRSTAT